MAAFLKNKKVIPGLVTGVRWPNSLFLVPFALGKKMHASLPIDRQPVASVAMLTKGFSRSGSVPLGLVCLCRDWFLHTIKKTSV